MGVSYKLRSHSADGIDIFQIFLLSIQEILDDVFEIQSSVKRIKRPVILFNFNFVVTKIGGYLKARLGNMNFKFHACLSNWYIQA